MTDLEPLTAAQVRALRSADAICFDHHADGTGAMRAIRRAEHTSSGFEETVTIPVDSRVRAYDGSSGPFVAYHGIMYAPHDLIASTLVRAVKPGWVVRLTWRRGNNTPVIEEAGLVADDLLLSTAPNLTARAQHFLVARQVGRDNTARMVREAR